MVKKDEVYIIDRSKLLWLVLGAFSAIIILLIWNVITLSLLSPYGPEICLFGFRIKHWLIGIVFMVMAIPLIKVFPEMGYFFMGFGVILAFDEIDELIV